MSRDEKKIKYTALDEENNGCGGYQLSQKIQIPFKEKCGTPIVEISDKIIKEIKEMKLVKKNAY